VLHPCKDGLQPVVVGLLNRIEFVIVAAGAVHSQSQERGAGGQDHVIQIVGALLQPDLSDFAQHCIVSPSHQEAGSDLDVGIARGNLIACQLVQDHTIEWLVLVERPNNVISERPCLVAQKILLVAGTLAKTDDIQPVTPPPFAIVR
jgi:hypothetical protein